MGKVGRFGIFGGQYVPETVMNAVHELEEAYGSNNGALYGSAIRDTPDDNGGGIHPGNPDSGNRSQ